MGSYGDVVMEQMSEHLQSLANDLMALHANLRMVLTSFGSTLPPDVLMLLERANTSCDRAMANVVAMKTRL
jgi:hypothetical protein